MNINSYKLNHQDFDYFKNNFIVINSSVNTLDEAEHIFIGEYHSHPEHELKMAWLVEKLAKRGDIFRTESVPSVLPLIDLTPFIREMLEIEGWDSYEGLKIEYDAFEQTNLFLKAVEEMFVETDMEKMQENIRTLQNARNLIENTYNEIRETIELNQIEEENFWQNIQLFDASSADFLVSNTSHNLYLHNQLLFLELANTLLKMQLGKSFAVRNKSLADHIIRPLPPGKTCWYHGGEMHFRLICSTQVPGDKEAAEVFQNALKGKKYVILLPTDWGISSRVYAHAKQYFEEAWQKISAFTNALFGKQRIVPQKIFKGTQEQYNVLRFAWEEADASLAHFSTVKQQLNEQYKNMQT